MIRPRRATTHRVSVRGLGPGNTLCRQLSLPLFARLTEFLFEPSRCFEARVRACHLAHSPADARHLAHSPAVGKMLYVP